MQKRNVDGITPPVNRKPISSKKTNNVIFFVLLLLIAGFFLLVNYLNIK